MIIDFYNENICFRVIFFDIIEQKFSILSDIIRVDINHNYNLLLLLRLV